jgi:hypothetical protein
MYLMAKLATQKKSIYSVHPGVLMTQKWMAELKEKTGRTLEEWLKLIKKEGPPTEKERREWLKTKYELGTNTAWWFAERSVGKGEETGDGDHYLKAAEKYVEEMFSGKKEHLRPIYDALLKLGLNIGRLYRNHVFAQIKPTTQTRIDFGLSLGNMKTPKRLIDTGGYAKKDRITHRFEITSLKDIDEEVKRWLKVAYDRDA